MFCRTCGHQMPDNAPWCFDCGTPFTAWPPGTTGSAAGAQPCAAPAPYAPSLSRHVGDEMKARSRDAWAGIKLFAKSPVGGLAQSYAMFEPARAMRVGIAFAVIYEIAFFAGVYLLASRVAGVLGMNVRVTDTSAGNLLKVILVGLVPFASLIGAGALARMVFHGTGVLAGDVFTAGASLLPFGAAVLLAALVGIANSEVIAVFFAFAFSYNILMLYSGCSRIAGIPEAGAAPAVPVMLLVSAWLTKVIVAAML